jgi:hypothetical protein
MLTPEQIAGLLQTLGLRYHESNGRLVVPFKAEDTSYQIQIMVDGPLVRLVAGDLLPVPDRRMGEVLTLANFLNAHRLRFGAFWIDSGRDLGFEVTLPVGDELPLDTLGLTIAGFSAIDAFFAAFAAVVWAGATAEEALDSLRALRQRQAEERANADQHVDQDEDGGIDIAI